MIAELCQPAPHYIDRFLIGQYVVGLRCSVGAIVGTKGRSVEFSHSSQSFRFRFSDRIVNFFDKESECPDFPFVLHGHFYVKNLAFCSVSILNENCRLINGPASITLKINHSHRLIKKLIYLILEPRPPICSLHPLL